MSAVRRSLAIFAIAGVVGLAGLMMGASAAEARVGSRTMPPVAPTAPPSTTAPGTTNLGTINTELSDESSSKLRTMLMGGVLFCVAAVAPFTVMKLIPFAEGIEALEGTSRYITSRPMQGLSTTSAGMNVAGTNFSKLLGKDKGGAGAASAATGAASALSGATSAAAGLSGGGGGGTNAYGLAPGSPLPSPGTPRPGQLAPGSALPSPPPGAIPAPPPGTSGAGGGAGATRQSRIGQWARRNPATAVGTMIAPGFGTVAGKVLDNRIHAAKTKRVP